MLMALIVKSPLLTAPEHAFKVTVRPPGGEGPAPKWIIASYIQRIMGVTMCLCMRCFFKCAITRLIIGFCGRQNAARHKNTGFYFLPDLE